MRVGVYIDAYNLYYGGRRHFGRGMPGWRWLDLRSLASSLARWEGASLEHIVYCTARVDANTDSSASVDQNVYLAALEESSAVDHIEYGRYVAWPRTAPLANRSPKGAAVLIDDTGQMWDPSLPLQRRELRGHPRILAETQKIEEKGSDVNVATHLLVDTLRNTVDGAIVISNDSDLGLAVSTARQSVPVGVVNPGPRPLAGALKDDAAAGVGGHWWRSLTPSDYTSNQLPNEVGPWRKPAGW